MRKIAEFYNIDIKKLLDSYNLFLYNGQGRQIKELRSSLNLTQYEFGKLLGVKSYMVKNWENEKVRICKSSWKKLIDNKQFDIIKEKLRSYRHE